MLPNPSLQPTVRAFGVALPNKVLTTVAVLLLASCAIKHKTLYAPVDERYVIKGTVCGHVPYVYAALPLDTQMAVIAIAPEGRGLAVGIEISLKNGESVRLQSADLEIELFDPPRRIRATIPYFHVAALPQGRREELGPMDLLTGKSRIYDPERWKGKDLKQPELDYLTKDFFRTQVSVDITPPQKLVLHFPEAIANGKRVVNQSIEFAKQEKTAVYACVQ